MYDPSYNYETWQQELNRMLEQYKPMKDPSKMSGEMGFMGIGQDPKVEDFSTFDENLDEKEDDKQLDSTMTTERRRLASKLMEEDAIRNKAMLELMTPDERAGKHLYFKDAAGLAPSYLSWFCFALKPIKKRQPASGHGKRPKLWPCKSSAWENLKSAL